MLTRLTADISAKLIERGATAASTPMLNSTIAAVAPRFGVVVSERAVASALPVLGALGGATINMLFVRHFQRIAHGHFTIRRLEREYGAEAVQTYYRGLTFVAPEPERLEAGRR